MATPARDKARIALGVVVVVGVFALETVIADRIQPNPLSPFVWSSLALLAGAALAAFFYYRRRARDAGQGN